MDPGETTTETALRETFEEIGVNAESVEIWGHLKSVIRRQADFNVTPIVGYISDERVLENLVVNSDEVQAVFTIPIDELIKKAGLTKFQSKRMKYTLPSFDSTEFNVYFLNNFRKNFKFFRSITMLRTSIFIPPSEFGGFLV